MTRFFQRLGTPMALLAIIALFTALSPSAFGTASNLINITQQMALLAMIAVGATFVLVLWEFDLSVGALASWSGICVVTLLQAGATPMVAIGLALLSSTAFGVVSGLLVARFAVPSFIATLALGTVVAGFTFWLSGGATLFGGLPDGFRTLTRGTAFGLPRLTWWIAAGALAAGLILTQTAFGRRLYAIGGNAEAARLAGVPMARDRTIAFAISATLAGLTGILLASRLGSAHPTGGDGFLLQAYAAVFLGTTAFRDGEANIAGSIVGAAIIATLANGLTILGTPSYVQDMLTGAIIILAVLVRRFAIR
ncbi:ABC transporter permease [Fodinicurvata sp. EGI_FJ10296]|uniref:ABC transporter permease n=1 Tax=Fodinicurvata sp. EGI_FJ10296 TaxID=3231908 RepID=UPI00345694E1